MVEQVSPVSSQAGGRLLLLQTFPASTNAAAAAAAPAAASFHTRWWQQTCTRGRLAPAATDGCLHQSNNLRANFH